MLKEAGVNGRLMGACLTACPKLHLAIKFPSQHSCFLRTYSARIYSIETNSSLACLHMPHPSNPVDDTSIHPYNREHGSLRRVSRTFGSCLASSACSRADTCQRVECQSDGFLSSLRLLYSCNNIVKCNPTCCSPIFTATRDCWIKNFCRLES